MDSSSKMTIIDPSDKFRPEKNEDLFRNYTSSNAYYTRVQKTYYQMHTHQTYEYANKKLQSWTRFDHEEMTIMEAVDKLNLLVDESDPDVDIPNSVHAFQTGERLRQVYPEKDWLHLTGLVHDLGKVMALHGEPQWFVVGDTYPVGCRFSDDIVFGQTSFEDNPDFNNPLYNTELGVYEKNCGFDNVTMSWGHDEYLYHVLKAHTGCGLPEEALYIIRYHSFYPWHTAQAYKHLSSNKDIEMLPWLLMFNRFDLYSKADTIPDMEGLRDYYQTLVDKYIPGKVKW